LLAIHTTFSQSIDKAKAGKTGKQKQSLGRYLPTNEQHIRLQTKRVTMSKPNTIRQGNHDLPKDKQTNFQASQTKAFTSSFQPPNAVRRTTRQRPCHNPAPSPDQYRPSSANTSRSLTHLTHRNLHERDPKQARLSKTKPLKASNNFRRATHHRKMSPLTSHTRKSPPATIPFTLCNHTTPPTPRPALPPPRTAPPSYAHWCLSCDASTRLAAQSLILDAYNGSIYDQACRLRIALARRGTPEEGRYDREMTEEGERRITGWRISRAEEVLREWEGFLARWNGGDDGNGGRLQLALKMDGEGGYVVEGLPE
jgi:hypothetical protein